MPRKPPKTLVFAEPDITAPDLPSSASADPVRAEQTTAPDAAEPAAPIATPALPPVPAPKTAEPMPGTGYAPIRRWAAFSWIGAGIALFIFASLLAIVAGEAMNAARIEFTLTLEASPKARTDCAIGQESGLGYDSTPAAWQGKSSDTATERTDCQAVWGEALQRVLTGTAKNGALSKLDQDAHKVWLRPWLVADGKSGRLSLRLPFLLQIVAIILLLIGCGKAVMEHPLGTFVDDRNRVSLTRVQLIAWTIILVSGITVFGLFNTGFAAQEWVGLAQRAHVPDITPDKTLAEALMKKAQAFPKLDYYLWAVLGISIGTTGISAMLINRARASVIEGMVKNADTRIEERNDSSEVGWTDLILGETVTKARMVDIARVQHVVITGILILTYFHLLWASARAIDGVSIARVMSTGTSVFTAMPTIDQTFVTLLLISHAALLASKIADMRSKG
jgi:hypothetical protein